MRLSEHAMGPRRGQLVAAGPLGRVSSPQASGPAVSLGCRSQAPAAYKQSPRALPGLPREDDFLRPGSEQYFLEQCEAQIEWQKKLILHG